MLVRMADYALRATASTRSWHREIVLGPLSSKQLELRVGLRRRHREGARAQVEVKIARDGDDQVRPVAVLEQGIFERRRPADKEAAAPAALVLSHPVAAAVLANEEQRGIGPAGQEHFTLAHGTSPFSRRGRCRPCMMPTIGTLPPTRCAGSHRNADSDVFDAPGPARDLPGGAAVPQ